MQCPINSRTTSEGAINCVCRNGYYRTDSDPLQMPCTSMYRIDAVIYELKLALHTNTRTQEKPLISNMNFLTHIHFTPASR